MTVVIHPNSELGAAPQIQRVTPPQPGKVFAARARRFAQLAEGHALADWLRYLGRIAQAQHDVAQQFPDVALPDAQALERAHEFSMPPLAAHSWQRDQAWRAALRQITAQLPAGAPAETAAALTRLDAQDDATLESLAAMVLNSEMPGASCALPPAVLTAVLPLVAAALEVYWTAMAARIGSAIAPLDVTGICPSCGFLPVASVVRIHEEVPNLRYLHCPLCNTEWNMVRITCSACNSTDGIAYQQIAEPGSGVPGAVRAETCDACMSYLKIIYRNKDAAGDPVADDLATLALDVLVDAMGYQRCGPNLLFVPGDA